MISGYRAVLQAPRKLELEPREFPDPGPGELLLETEVTLISTGTELTAYSGDFPPDSVWSHYIQYPVGIGYSHVGRVVQVGEDVEGYAPGERMLSMGAHATHALSSGKQVWRVPDGVEATDATFGVLAEIVMGGLRRGRIQFGESVVIVGAGLLGQLAAHFCSRIGAWPVVTVDPVPGVRQESAARMGAGAVLACTAVEARERVEALTRGRMADVVIEVTGNPHAFPGAVRLARRLGRVVLLGSPRGPVTLDLHDEVHTLGLEILGAHNSTHPAAEGPHTPWTISRHVELFLEWLAGGVVDVSPLVTHRYPWRKAAEAYEMLFRDRSMALGVLLDWQAT